MSKTLLKFDGWYWGICLEFKLQDMWIGMFWKCDGSTEIDIWICLIPCFPIHYWSGRESLIID
ncbi:MAG: hypothetical protein ACW98K_15615 [Candidatus Kariarchaeaceae archaeon]|jgi:hypothetical protein